MKARLAIKQIFYEKSQVPELDPAFEPLDCTSNPAPWLFEIYWLQRFYDSGIYEESDYTGLMSWKFGTKTRISGKEFIEFIHRNPGFDVYFVNPYPHLAYRFFNVWEHGENVHPGIQNPAQMLLDKAGYEISIADSARNDHRTLLYCNYWVAGAEFWKAYMAFIQPLVELCTALGPVGPKNPFFETTIHEGRPAPFFPFIFERLFSTFLTLTENLRACHYVFDRDEILQRTGTPEEQRIIEICMPAVDELDSGLSRNNGAELRSEFNALTRPWTDKLISRVYGKFREVG